MGVLVGAYRFERNPGCWLIRLDGTIAGWWVDCPGHRTAVFNAATNRRAGMARTKPEAARLLTASLQLNGS